MTHIHSLLNYFNATPKGSIYHEVTGILLKNLSRIKDMSIIEMSELCFASTTTLSRLARHLGFNTFSEFRTGLYSSYAKYPFSNRCMPMSLNDVPPDCHNYLDYVSKIIDILKQRTDESYMREIAYAMHCANRVSLYHMSVTDVSCVQFQYDMITAGKDAIVLSDLTAQVADAAELSRGDLIIVRAGVFPPELVDALRSAKERGAVLLFISPENIPLLSRLSDFFLSYPSDGTSAVNYYFFIYTTMLTLTHRNLYLDK